MPETSQIERVFPHTVYTASVFEEVVKKDKMLPKVISVITEKNPGLTGYKPDTILVDKVGDKVITTVTYNDEKFVSRVVSDLKTEVTQEIDTFKIEENIVPIILETTVSETGKTTIVSNSLE